MRDGSKVHSFHGHGETKPGKQKPNYLRRSYSRCFYMDPRIGFWKSILNFPRSTPFCMVRVEVQCKHLAYQVLSRSIKFWCHLLDRLDDRYPRFCLNRIVQLDGGCVRMGDLPERGIIFISSSWVWSTYGRAKSYRDTADVYGGGSKIWSKALGGWYGKFKALMATGKVKSILVAAKSGRWETKA